MGQMNEMFTIPLNGLASGENCFFWEAGKEFFESFGNSEIFDAGLDVSVMVEKSGRYVGVDCDVAGTVTVECDRCLASLVMPVDVQIRLSVKYGSEDSSEEMQEGDREVVWLHEDDAELNLGQIVYDYVCLSLPMQRHHADGGCDPDTVKYLAAEEAEEDKADAAVDSPFASLKDMFK